MTQPARPAGRTLAEFRDTDQNGPLYQAEEALRQAAARGLACHADKLDDVRVRADFIRFLALGGDDETAVHEKGVDLENATIEGQLDLNQCKGVLPLVLDDCTLSSNGPVLLRDAHLSLLSLDGSTVSGGITADRATVQGNVFLRNGASIEGEVRFLGAKIDGDLSANGSTLYSDGSNALSCDGAQIGGNVDLRGNARIIGEVRLLSAKINGNLLANGSTLYSDGSNALSCDGAQIGGNIDLRGNARIIGQVRLIGTTIDGNLIAVATTLHEEGGKALSCDRARIGGNFDLRDGANIVGQVRLLGARVSGHVTVAGGTLKNSGDSALSCDAAWIGGNVDLRRSARIYGEVRLNGAVIDGSLYALDSKFFNKGRFTINGERNIVHGSAAFSNDFTSQGSLRLPAAYIGGNLNLRRSVIEQPGDTAVDLRDVRVEGTLTLDSVRDGQTVKGAMRGAVDLRGAHVNYLDDNFLMKNILYYSGSLCLDHFRFTTFIRNSDINVADRLRWLSLQPTKHLEENFRPQPYEQLASVYREMGHEDRYHEVLLEKKKRQLRSQVGITSGMASGDDVWAWARNPLAVLKLLFFELPVGYGHRVRPMFYGFIALFLISFAVFWRASAEGYIVPQDTRMIAYEQMIDSCEKPWTRCELDILEDYPEFNSFIYAADVLLPVVGLEQQTAWTPNWVWLNVLKWFNILYGWFTGLMLVAIVSGVVQRA